VHKSFKLICCYCGHIHTHHNIDILLDRCEACKAPLSMDDSWCSHAVRIFVEDADPKLIKHFVEEVKSKRIRLKKNKRSVKRKPPSRLTKKVA
jgi:hypothetical protein